MNTATRTSDFPFVVSPSLNAEEKQLQKKLSKAGQFMRDFPNGLFVINNRKVVNQ
jgi:hypothetical protein